MTIRKAVFAILFLASVCVAIEADPERVRSISGKLHCSCGCRQVLDECSHTHCERKPAMRQRIAAAIMEGKTDDQILSQMAATYGSDILLTPMFRGFDTMLWIVPVTGAVIAVGVTLAVQRRRTGRSR